MISPAEALSSIPIGLRKALLAEFSDIVNSFLERRWSSSELSGGRFCEIVYTILDGHAKGAFPPGPTKPSNFVDACRKLESNPQVPRSFQILIPRLLPAMYEIRNNRNVGHVGGDVDPDLMDSAVVLALASWILAELVRVFHSIPTHDAQRIVNSLSERRLPLVWRSGDKRRVLKPNLRLKDQILLLLGSANGTATVEELLAWTGYKKRGYFTRLLRQLHDDRFIELHDRDGDVEMLPPGAEHIRTVLDQEVYLSK